MTRFIFALLAALVLAGCSSTYRVSSTVNSYARWSTDEVASVQAPSVPSGPQTYQFDRLPSQMDGGTGQDQQQLETWTQTALEPLGWTLSETPSDWLIQVSRSTLRSRHEYWGDTWGSLHFQHRIDGNSGLLLMLPLVVVSAATTSFHREVSVVIRNKASGRVAYETRAKHTGQWNNTPQLWQTIVQASLKDFPAPPTAQREVHIDVPR